MCCDLFSCSIHLYASNKGQVFNYCHVPLYMVLNVIFIQLTPVIVNSQKWFTITGIGCRIFLSRSSLPIFILQLLKCVNVAFVPFSLKPLNFRSFKISMFYIPFLYRSQCGEGEIFSIFWWELVSGVRGFCCLRSYGAQVQCSGGVVLFNLYLCPPVLFLFLLVFITFFTFYLLTTESQRLPMADVCELWRHIRKLV